jgi:hypothetical protein
MDGRNPEMRQLERNYIFEFAGMPQGGKTAVKEILAHYLKRMEYPVVEFNGGSRHSGFPIYRMPIGELNQKLAYNIENFVRSIAERQSSDHNIYLLDRGLIDRCIFTNALARDKKISREQEAKLCESLTVPVLLDKLDGVFIFVSSPDIALDREYAGKLVERENVRSQGDVMNEHFLREMRSAAEEWYNLVDTQGNHYVKYVERIDTTPTENSPIETEMKKFSEYVFNGIRKRYPELELELIATKSSSHARKKPF